jgi:exosome complex component RRP4
MTPTKIPRLIGRRGSMINSIKRETGTNITIGQNGLILISGKRLAYENLAIRVVHLIEAEAHTSGLTERVTKFIKEEKSVLNDKN